MPISRKRKKKGKKVGSGTQLKIDPNKPSSITLQDLINVLAYQEANPEEAAGNKPKIVEDSINSEFKSEPIESAHSVSIDPDEIVSDTIPSSEGENEDGR